MKQLRTGSTGALLDPQKWATGFEKRREHLSNYQVPQQDCASLTTKLNTVVGTQYTSYKLIKMKFLYEKDRKWEEMHDTEKIELIKSQ
jgi:hypothetical protein